MVVLWTPAPKLEKDNSNEFEVKPWKHYLCHEVTDERDIGVTPLPALLDVLDDRHDVAASEQVHHAVEKHLAHLELDENLQLVLARLEQPHEQIEDVGVEQRVHSSHLVEQRKVHRRVLGAQLEIGRLEDGGFNPPEHAHGHDWETDVLVQSSELRYQLGRPLRCCAHLMRFFKSLKT